MAELSKRVEELERRVEKLLKRNSSNSDQPPSSDSPYRKPGASKEAGQWSAFYARLCCLIALLIWLDEPFALEFCGGKEVRAQK